MEFNVSITEAFLRRSYGRGALQHPWALMIALTVILAMTGVDLLAEGELSALSVVGLTVTGVAVVLLSAVWIRQRRMVRAWAKRQGNAPVRFRLTEDAISTWSMTRDTTTRWCLFTALLITDQQVSLLSRDAGTILLPTDQLPAGALHFLEGRFRANGKLVDDRRTTVRNRPDPATPGSTR